MKSETCKNKVLKSGLSGVVTLLKKRNPPHSFMRPRLISLRDAVNFAK